MTNSEWEHIAPLSEDERSIDLAAIQPLYETWRAAKRRLQENSAASLRQFTERLVRRLSVETGILEHLYDLDRGTTEALVANGFAQDLISHASTDVEPSHLIDVLRDQEAAIQLVIDCVSGNRPLTKGLIHELHEIITKHQSTTTAVDQFGTTIEIPLQRGAFKTHDNNPKRPDGTVHQYCPPVHVDAEIEQLLQWLDEYRNEDPIIVSAWFHHRFAQIHPYQDGNGRVVRTLTTLILLRSELLPLVIDRDRRREYISALERADAGDLEPLAQLFANLERTAILQALSVDADVEIEQERRLTRAVVESLEAKFSRRRERKDAELRKVNDVAIELRGRARRVVEGAMSALEGPVSHIAEPEIRARDGGPDWGNAHWYKFEVVQSGNQAGKYVNFDEDHYFIKATIRVDRERLVFVTSLHHVGRDLSGVMEATAFARLESYEDSDDREYVSQDFFLCSTEPFVFTYQTNVDDIVDAFDRWLDAAVAIAFKEFGDRL